MADKKITQLTEATAVSQDDLFVIVDDPTGTPINKKVTRTNLFGNVTHITTASAERASIKGTLESNTAHAATNVFGGQFVAQKNSGISGNSQYGLHVTSTLVGASSNLTNEHAAAKMVLNVGPAANLVVNTHGVIVAIANTGARAAQPQSFISLQEATSGTLSTKYLFDIGNNGAANVSANLTANSGNTTVVFTCAGNTANTLQVTHKLKVRVNGTDFWFCVSNNA